MGAAPPVRTYLGTAPYAMRVALGLVGIAYFHVAGQVTGFLPISSQAVVALIAAYALANLLMLSRRLHAGFGLVVSLDLAMLAVIVLEDPFPAAPVTILLLSTTFDYGRWLPPAVFAGSSVAALGILLLNAWARLHSQSFPLSSEGAWLNGEIGLLMINFFAVARAAARTRAERRRMAARIDELNRREEGAVRLRLRMARAGESLQFTGQPRAEFAHGGLGCFVSELGAVAGAVYELVVEGGDAALFPLATHAADLPRLQGRRVALDQGLVGACAAHGLPIELDQVPEGYFQLECGLGRGAPPRLLILPLKVQTRLVGIMELALTGAPNAEDREVLERMLPMFATGLILASRIAAEPGRLVTAAPGIAGGHGPGKTPRTEFPRPRS